MALARGLVKFFGAYYVADSGQGLTLVHFSAQPESFLAH
jgi:hypothetical protein